MQETTAYMSLALSSRVVTLDFKAGWEYSPSVLQVPWKGGDLEIFDEQH